MFLVLFFYLAFKELEFAFKVKSVLQAKGRQCNMLLHCDEKTASEFALGTWHAARPAAAEGRGIVVTDLAVPEEEHIPICGDAPLQAALFSRVSEVYLLRES